MSSSQNLRKERGKPRKTRGSEEESPTLLPEISEAKPLELPTAALGSLSIGDNSEHKFDSEDFAKEYFNTERSPFWSGSDKGWQLTWGIWHRLPREEQKKIALQHGLKSIGEFEEYVSLQQAVDDSEYSMVEATENQLPTATTTSSSSEESLTNSNNSPKSDYEDSTGQSKGDNQDESDDDDDDDQHILQHEKAESGTILSSEELVSLGGNILILPSEILHQIFSWLPADAYGTLALVSPHWKFITRIESVYKRLCERLYLNQSKRRQLHVSRFGGSYRRMLEIRPRVRAAGGCYVLKYSKYKKIERDMFCEIPIGAVLETVYYRYLYFHEDGRCLYALSNSPPKVMFPRILNVILHREETDPAIVNGTFQVQKYNCTVIAKQPWHTVKFEITIVPDSPHGRFAALTIDRHLTSVSGCLDDWSYDLVEHTVPDKQFRFMKDARL